MEKKMSNRLDKEREARLQPHRMNTAIIELDRVGILEFDADDTTIKFMFNGNQITFFPYSGWHHGKGIKPGRGLQNLLKQLK